MPDATDKAPKTVREIIGSVLDAKTKKMLAERRAKQEAKKTSPIRTKLTQKVKIDDMDDINDIIQEEDNSSKITDSQKQVAQY